MTKTTAKIIRTVGDVRDEKALADARMFAKWDKRDAPRLAAEAAARADYEYACQHDLGALMRQGKWVFYTFTGGYREATDPRTL